MVEYMTQYGTSSTRVPTKDIISEWCLGATQHSTQTIFKETYSAISAQIAFGGERETVRNAKKLKSCVGENV